MVTNEFDLARCLDQVRQHDEEAARALVDHLYPLVIRIVRSHLPWRMAEEDLAQEVMVKVFSRLEQYRPRHGVPFEHWVSRLAVRTCLDALRATERRPELRWSDLTTEQAAWLDFMLVDQATPPETSATAARELVARLLAYLSPDDRLVISLMDLEEKSVREVGGITGWSLPLVKVRAFRARQRLRKVAKVFLEQNRYERL